MKITESPSETEMEQALKKLFKTKGWNINTLLMLLVAALCSVIVYFLTCYFSTTTISRLDLYTAPTYQGQSLQQDLSQQNLSQGDQYWMRAQERLLNDRDFQTKISNEISPGKRVSKIRDVIQLEPLPNGVRFLIRAKNENQAKRLAELFTQYYLSVVFDLKTQGLMSLNVKKDALEKALINIKSQFEEGGDFNLNMVQNEALMKSYIEAVIKRLYYDALLSALAKCEQDKISPLSISAIASTPIIRDMLDKLAQLEIEIAKQTVKLGKTNKSVVALKAEYNIIETQLSHEITMTIRQLSTDRMVTFTVEEQLKKILFNHIDFEYTNSLLAKKQSELNLIIQKQLLLENDIAFLQNKLVISDVKISNKPNYLLAAFASAVTFCLVLFVFNIIFLRKSLPRENDKDILDDQAFEINSHAFDYLHTDKKEETEHTSISVKTPISVKTLANYIDEHDDKVIALFGATAEEEGARLALSLFQSGKKTLLIDIAGSEITRHIGMHLGLSDVLAGDATLEDTIHHDDETGIDVLPNGGVSYLRAAAFSHRFPVILKTLKKTYSAIILTIAAEPFLTLPDLLQAETLKVLVPARDSALWEETLLEAGFSDFIYLTNAVNLN